MGNPAQGCGVTTTAKYFWGPASALGLIVAVSTCVLDQALKLWVLHGLQLAGKGRVAMAPFVDFVLTWNTGISYGWLQQDGPFGQWALLALMAMAVALLWLWLARTGTRLGALALGLIIGGAVGNAIDRLILGGVADFFSLHAFGFYWYVFNIADVAIVAGVAGLLYDSFGPDRKGAANASS